VQPLEPAFAAVGLACSARTPRRNAPAAGALSRRTPVYAAATDVRRARRLATWTFSQLSVAALSL
jgi:hypothetical protein